MNHNKNLNVKSGFLVLHSQGSICAKFCIKTPDARHQLPSLLFHLRLDTLSEFIIHFPKPDRAMPSCQNPAAILGGMYRRSSDFVDFH